VVVDETAELLLVGGDAVIGRFIRFAPRAAMSSALRVRLRAACCDAVLDHACGFRYLFRGIAWRRPVGLQQAARLGLGESVGGGRHMVVAVVRGGWGGPRGGTVQHLACGVDVESGQAGDRFAQRARTRGGGVRVQGR
jgi:hypothetical protein